MSAKEIRVTIVNKSDDFFEYSSSFLSRLDLSSAQITQIPLQDDFATTVLAKKPFKSSGTTLTQRH